MSGAYAGQSSGMATMLCTWTRWPIGPVPADHGRTLVFVGSDHDHAAGFVPLLVYRAVVDDHGNLVAVPA